MSSWDEYANGWDKDESAIAYSVAAFRSLTSIVKLENMTILDIGCGTGLFVQWDWLPQNNQSDFGLSEERVGLAFKNAGLTTVSLTRPFTMSSSKGVMPVLMGVAQNA